MKLPKRLKQKILCGSLKSQMILLFLPLTLLFIILIGVVTYLIEGSQVRNNALYLINNTVLQTGNILNEKMSAVFTQLSQLCESTSVSNLFTDEYDPESQYQKYNDILEAYRNMNEVSNNYSDIVDSMFFKTNHDTEIAVYKDLAPANTSVDLNSWVMKYQSSKYGFYWQNLHTDAIFKTQPPRQVLSLFKVVGNGTSKSQMMFIFNLKPSYFLQLVENSKISRHGYMIILSKDGVLYPEHQDPQYRLQEDDVKKLQSAFKENGQMSLKSIAGRPLIVSYRPLMNNEWIVAAVVPEKDLTETFSSLRLVLLIIVITLAVCFAFLCVRFAAAISHPIEQLSQKVSEWQQGNTQVDFSVETASENEISILSQGLHSLKDSVTALLKQVAEEQKQKYKMELLAMQAQIRPHFLYNTLASIKSLVDMGENREAGAMCDALETYYRIGVSDGKDIIPVRQEVEHVSSYLHIQQMRYQQDFDFFVNVSEEIMDCSILKLTLQPLVENAVYHGMKQKEGKGTIVLSGGRKGGALVFSVYDDGAGMEPEKLCEVQKSIADGIHANQNGNFGLRNVSSRLRLLYNGKAGLSIDSVRGMYTEVTVTVPLDGREAPSGSSSLDDCG